MYTTVDKSKGRIGHEIAISIRKHWIALKLATLHWGSKLMPALSNQIKLEERLTVVVNNPQELKLPGVLAYKPGTDCKSAKVIADITFDLLFSWNCMDSIVNMAFNTIGSNMGYVTALCITLVSMLSLCWESYLISCI